MTVHTSRIEVATNVAVADRNVVRSGVYRMGLKRLFDVSLILLTLPFVLPFLAIISLAMPSSSSAITTMERKIDTGLFSIAGAPPPAASGQLVYSVLIWK